MNRTSLIISILVLGTVSAGAGTFEPAPYLAEPHVDVLTKQVANEQFGRDLFGDPYATVVVGNIDVYDRFPYLEARYFQVVSDPAWNRLLLGEIGQGLSAFDGTASRVGALKSPRGLSTDGRGLIYLADSGNDRVLVFRTVTEFDRIRLEPVYSIDDLNDPYGVAHSDHGTPFDAGDDVLYVANTGKNEVRRYTLGTSGATLTATVGTLGSGTAHFAGPIAIVVGRRNGANDENVYVSDAHNGRIVHLRDTGSSLSWTGAVPHGMGLVTSLDTDHFGNVYAASPQAGRITKLTPGLIPLAGFAGETQRPRGVHVVFANVTDHRNGTHTRAGQGSAVVVEEWAGANGLRMLNLGVEFNDAVAVDDQAAVRLTLTDNANVVAEIVDPANGQTVARRNVGLLAAGEQTIRFGERDFVSAWSEGDYRVTLRATSTYSNGATSRVEVPIHLSGSGGPAMPDRLALLGNIPNPFNPSTTIRFSVPAGPQQSYRLRVYDVRGAFVRELASGRIGGGTHEARWDGRDRNGSPVSSGIYLYRLEVGARTLTGKMALVK
ncbi:MAG TPA: FlgD immunoglobulin-like domain containing protein [Candidatus Krumholzibacteria bacterium]|nr:FlgD immunoglobulin-like domain containing protein [Candidatus Krumholzibacteria bacterium]